jgi:large subunit ribosomal protein L7/L12
MPTESEPDPKEAPEPEQTPDAPQRRDPGRKVVQNSTRPSTDDLIEQFKELTLKELSDFVKKFEEVFEVTAAAPVAVAAAGGAAAVEEVVEKESFDVILESVGEKKIQVIKEVRALTSLGLGEAKAVVDGAPGAVLQGVNKEAAEKAKAQLEKAGARVALS